ncbi:MAG: hypothetical protein AAGA76_01425 [Pseudomonadota bacterium]
MENYLIADTVVSFAAFCGLLLLISSIRRSDPSSLTRRFEFGLNIIAVMLGARILAWTTGIGIFDTINLIAAGLIPLAAILLTEGLMRRHAPFPVKMVVAGFAVAVIPLSLFPDSLAEPARIIVVLLCQIFAFGSAAWLVLTRDRGALSTVENRVIDRIALSLLLIIPFLITDFRFTELALPVRLGGVAILALCWLTISLERAHLNNRDMIRAFMMLFWGATFTGIALAWLNELDVAGYVQTVVITLSATLVAVIYNDSVALRYDDRRNSLLRHMAEGNISTSEDFLRGLQNHVLVEGALILEERDLKDFDLKLLKNIFAEAPIRRLVDVQREGGDKREMEEQLRWLFERFNATHVIVADNNPVVLVALNMPSLASSPGAETELKAVQRMAFLISMTEAKS